MFTNTKTARRFVGLSAPAYFSPLKLNVASVSCYKTPQLNYTVRVFFAVTLFLRFAQKHFSNLLAVFETAEMVSPLTFA